MKNIKPVIFYTRYVPEINDPSFVEGKRIFYKYQKEKKWYNKLNPWYGYNQDDYGYLWVPAILYCPLFIIDLIFGGKLWFVDIPFLAITCFYTYMACFKKWDESLPR